MKLKNTQAEFDLITTLLNAVNSKEEYYFLIKRKEEISSSFSHDTSKDTERSVIE